MIYFFDIDGVLADCSHRLHYQEEKNYDKFYSADEILNDKPIRHGLDLYEDICSSPYSEIYFLTGRPFRAEEATKVWLERQGVIPAPMLMRKNHDYRKAGLVKLDNLRKTYEHLNWEGTAIFIDDDIENIKIVEEFMPNVKGMLFGTRSIKEND